MRVSTHHLFSLLTRVFFLLYNRKKVVKLLEENREHLYQANYTWLTSMRKHLRRSLMDGVIEASSKSKRFSFLSHPAPECSCMRYDPTKPVEASLGVMHSCPKWMDSEIQTQSKDKETEEDSDEDVSSSSGLFFKNIGGNNQNGGGELMKEESQLDDQEEIEGAD